jgi:hypothetical protein
MCPGIPTKRYKPLSNTLLGQAGPTTHPGDPPTSGVPCGARVASAMDVSGRFILPPEFPETMQIKFGARLIAAIALRQTKG